MDNTAKGQSFFGVGLNKASEQPVRAAHFIDVGGDAFDALAVAYIDQLKMALRITEAPVKKVIEHLYHYFPEAQPTQAYLTTADRLRFLITHYRTSELVFCMAYTLRQLSIDELFKNPSSYPEAVTALGEMEAVNWRDPKLALPHSVFKALAPLLQMDIILFHKGPGKELAERLIYPGQGQEECMMQLEIELQKKAYYPKTRSNTDFSHVHMNHLPHPKPVLEAPEEKEKQSAVLAQVKADRARLAQSYLQHSKTLSSMLLAEEIDLQSLTDLYIEFYPKSVYLDEELFNSECIRTLLQKGKDHEQQSA